MKPDSKIALIPPWTLLARIIFRNFLMVIFPTAIIDKFKQLEKAVRAAKEGQGLIVVFNHFSLRDAMEVNRSVIFNTPVLMRREVVNPLAYHQFNKLNEFIGRLFHGNFAPIVNNSTIAKKGFEHLPKGKGLSDFVNACKNVLEQGGAVTLAINAARTEKLEMDDQQKPIGFLLASLLAKGVKKYGILLVSFAVKNVKSYRKKDVGGMNFNKTYVITIGKYFSLSELLNQTAVAGKVSNADYFIRKELAKIVPKEYL